MKTIRLMLLITSLLMLSFSATSTSSFTSDFPASSTTNPADDPVFIGAGDIGSCPQNKKGKYIFELDRKLEELAKQLESAFENIDPNNPEAVFQHVNSIARRMLNLVEKSPDSDANMKELARLLLSITETTDPEALSNKLERLTEVLERLKP